MSGDNIQILNINNIGYCLSDSLFDKALLYTKGSRNARELIKKKDISEDNYIFARDNGEEWEETDDSNKCVDRGNDLHIL